jgi:hypothetical protein
MADEKWGPIFDRYLVNWGCDTSELEDDGIIPPSKWAIHVAANVALAVRNQGVPAPLRVVPSGDGGLVFEWKSPPHFHTLEVSENGAIEVNSFTNGRHVERIPLGHLSM